MKTKDIEFNADDLVGSVEAFAHHLTGKQKLTLRTATMPLPPPVKSLTPSQVRSIRKKLNVSQPVFAAMMNIPTVTAASWERGRRKPTGCGAALARHRTQASRGISRRLKKPISKPGSKLRLLRFRNHVWKLVILAGSTSLWGAAIQIGFKQCEGICAFDSIAHILGNITDCLGGLKAEFRFNDSD